MASTKISLALASASSCALVVSSRIIFAISSRSSLRNVSKIVAFASSRVRCAACSSFLICSIFASSASSSRLAAFPSASANRRSRSTSVPSLRSISASFRRASSSASRRMRNASSFASTINSFARASATRTATSLSIWGCIDLT